MGNELLLAGGLLFISRYHSRLFGLKRWLITLVGFYTLIMAGTILYTQSFTFEQLWACLQYYVSYAINGTLISTVVLFFSLDVRVKNIGMQQFMQGLLIILLMYLSFFMIYV